MITREYFGREWFVSAKHLRVLERPGPFDRYVSRTVRGSVTWTEENGRGMITTPAGNKIPATGPAFLDFLNLIEAGEDPEILF